LEGREVIICAAIHGILTGQTTASWPDKFDAWMAHRDPRVHVIKKEYAAGPFPRLNWFKNRRLAAGLVEEIELLCAFGHNNDQVWLIAHSNGAVIALRALHGLVERGIKVTGIILTGAACDSDVDRTGVSDLVSSGNLGRAIAFCSLEDGVVNTRGILGWLKWPYGNLGRVGWRRSGELYNDWKISSVFFHGGHTGYFAPNEIEHTFNLFHAEILEGAAQ
jgi:hypothetical protein